ncbi:MAG: PorT family protein [Candidatus Cloacimonetes bacterium]|nr:PorT family protein [Candidatus Cloacimonadota bacterium]
MKQVVVIVALLLVFSALNAQKSYGLRGGLSMVKVNDMDMIGDSDSKTAFHIGGMVYYPLEGDFIVQVEGLFSQRGGEYKESGYDGWDLWSETYKLNLTYLEVPVLVKYDIPLETFNIQPYAGASLGLLLSSKMKWTVRESGYSESGTEDIKDDTNDIDFGLLFGGDVLLRNQFLLGLRYHLGLSEVNEGFGGKNSAIMINAGYLLR